jgi:hypothetical protein
MKRVFVAAAAAALGTAIYLPAAFAGDTTAAAELSRTADQGTAAGSSQAPRCEWQYHYVGHHPRYEGYWALVR